MPSCPTHGMFDNLPNANGDIFCPECWAEAIKKGLGVEHIDKPSDYATSSISLRALTMPTDPEVSNMPEAMFASKYATAESTPKTTVPRIEILWGMKPVKGACPRCGEKALVLRMAPSFGALGGAVECEACTERNTFSMSSKVLSDAKQGQGTEEP